MGSPCDWHLETARCSRTKSKCLSAALRRVALGSSSQASSLVLTHVPSCREIPGPAGFDAAVPLLTGSLAWTAPGSILLTQLKHRLVRELLFTPVPAPPVPGRLCSSLSPHNTVYPSRSPTVSCRPGSLWETDASRKGVIGEIYRGADGVKGSLRNDDAPWGAQQR